MYLQRLFSALSLLLLLLFCCTICEATEAGLATAAAAAEKSTEILSPNIAKEKICTGSDEGEITSTIINLPFLVATDAVMAAVAGVNCKKNTDPNSNIKIVAKYIKTTPKDEWVTTFTTDKSWQTESAPKEIVLEKDSVKTLAATANKNNIYILLVKNSAQSDTLPNLKDEFVFVKGDFNSVQQPPLKITLETDKLADSFEKSFLKGKTFKNNLQILSAFVTVDENVVFIVKGEITEQPEGTTIFAIVKSKGSEQSLKELPVADVNKNCNLYFIPWKDKIIMIPSDCGDAGQKIQEFKFTRDGFTKNDEVVDRVWKFLKGKHDITTATINTTPLVLFTQEKPKTGEESKKDIHLWITDGKRTANIGIVFPQVDNGFYRSFVCTEKHLFSLHHKLLNGEKQDNIYNVTHLQGQMESITSVLNSWKEGNQKFLDLCKEAYTSDDVCSTDGLVGFLSGKGDSSNWEDEYNYVSAKVNGGAKNGNNGFKFAGKNKGAKWLVGKTAKDDQPYNFSDPGFTLVATVIIDNVSNDSHNSILGVGFKDDNKKIGLLCKKDATWSVYTTNDPKEKIDNIEPKQTCVAKQYQVALVHSNTEKKISFYVNWGIIGTLQQFEMDDDKRQKLEFYFGNDNTQNDVESHVTVTNVLLYNRPFEGDEIDNLKKYIKPVEETQLTAKIGDKNTNGNTGGNSDQQTPTKPPSPSEEKEEKITEAPSPSRTEDGGVGGGVRVFSLLLAVLCVSAPLLLHL